METLQYDVTDYRSILLANFNKVRVPEMEDRRNFFTSINGLNSGETFWCAQGTNPVPCCSCNTMEMVELSKSDCLVDFTSSLDHC